MRNKIVWLNLALYGIVLVVFGVPFVYNWGYLPMVWKFWTEWN